MKKVAKVKSKILGCFTSSQILTIELKGISHWKKIDLTIKKREKAAPYKHKFRNLKAPGASFFSPKTNIFTSSAY